ncbi:hypothetical protein TRAPUB_7417 [Trametes pubescens]|uniref:Uncharacterized protein n=1 Tax=Trametes pubescens TaxID=154538 RepID=A0A1M2V3F7_TRAPU|nr:hypothetical protein TRAPUB_7417 [Trametes pubescens]
MSSPACALAPSTNPKKRILADSDTEQRDAKRTKPQDDLLENELRKETKDKKKRRKKKRKVPVVSAQGVADADARVAPEASGSRSRSRSMTLAATPAPEERPEELAALSSLCAGPSKTASREASLPHSSSDKGKGRATRNFAATQDSQQQTLVPENQVTTKSNCLVNWFKAPPPDVPAHDVLPVWLRKKTCPHCRTVVKDRPIEIWTIKDMVATLVKSGLAAAPLLPLPPPFEEGAANADPWSGIFRPANRHYDIFPDGQPPELMQQLMGMRDDEDGGIYRCVDCHHEIEDGVCSQCGRVYPGHNPLDHNPDEFDDDVVGHWGAHAILDDFTDEDEDDDSIADGGGGGGWGRLPLEMIRQLFMPNGPRDPDSDSLYSDESRHDDVRFAAELVEDFVPVHPRYHHAQIDYAHEEGAIDEEDEEGYESSFIDDDGNDDGRPRRRHAPSVDLDRDSVIDLSEADEEPAAEDGEEDDVQFVGFGRRRGGGRAAIVITSEDEEDGDRSASEDDASGDDG